MHHARVANEEAQLDKDKLTDVHAKPNPIDREFKQSNETCGEFDAIFSSGFWYWLSGLQCSSFFRFYFHGAGKAYCLLCQRHLRCSPTVPSRRAGTGVDPDCKSRCQWVAHPVWIYAQARAGWQPHLQFCTPGQELSKWYVPVRNSTYQYMNVHDSTTIPNVYEAVHTSTY